jgi:hypothetical protein
MIRSCNDLGHLYASVTQQEIAKALEDAGYKGVKARDVRLNVNIKRVDHYDVHVKFAADLDAHVKLHVNADRKLDMQRAKEEEAAAAAAAAEAKSHDAGGQLEAAIHKDDKPKKEKKADKPAKEVKSEKPEKPAKDKGEKKAKA